MDKPSQLAAPKHLLRAQRIANATDTALKIPFTGIRFGLDSIVGLIPGVGDAVMLGASGYIIVLAAKMGVPNSLRAVMWRNCLIDFGLGLIPLAGDIGDLFFKANKKNVRLIEKWWVNTHQKQLKTQAVDHLEKWQKTMESHQYD